MKKVAEERLVTVCKKCKRASCWQGLFLCEDARYAGVIELTIKELKKLDLEHSQYWEEEE